MVHKRDDMPTEVREQMKGGNGSVTLCHLEQDNMPPNARLFATLTLTPGSSIGEHVHEGEAEMFYFMRGEGVVIDDGVRIPVKAGDAMTTMDGHAHSVENTGAEDLVLVAAIVLG